MIDRDILITRVIDGEASAEDWSALHSLAREDSMIWSELASAQQDHAELTAAVRFLTEPAESVESPILEHARAGLSIRLRTAATWGGWAVAAVLVVSFFTGNLGGSQTTGPTQRGSLLEFGSLGQAKEHVRAELTPDEALETYLANGARDGRVVALDPELHVVSAVALEGQGLFEVVYVRRIVERARVDMYRISENEMGQFVRLPIEELPKPSRPF